MLSALRWHCCRRAGLRSLSLTSVSPALWRVISFGWLGRLTTIYRRGEGVRKAPAGSSDGVLQQPPKPMSAAFVGEPCAVGETAAARHGGDMGAVPSHYRRLRFSRSSNKA